MTTQEIYSLANELTEKEISNVLNGWRKDKESNQLIMFSFLVSLGDSRAVALATTISEKYNSRQGFNSYYNAFCI